MPFPNEHAARIHDPEKYDHFRRENDKFGPGIDVIWGIPKDGAVEIQAIRFNAEKFTVEEAKEWFAEHEYKPISFEPAAGVNACLALEICASDSAVLARVEGLAYTGGILRLPGFRYPVVIQLSGLSIPDQVPLLCDHDTTVGSKIGQVRAFIDGRNGTQLSMSGALLPSISPLAAQIVAQHKSGGKWQLSVGVEPLLSEIVQGSRMVNGQMIQGPFYHVQKSRLREISVCPIGVDPGTELRIAASFSLSGGEQQMEFDAWLTANGFDPEAVKKDEKQTALLTASWKASQEPDPKPANKPADTPDDTKVIQAAVTTEQDIAAALKTKREAMATENKRMADVAMICAKYKERVKADSFATIEEKAILGGWTADQTELEMLRAERPAVPAVHVQQTAVTGKVLEAALCLGNGLKEEDVVKACGEESVVVARRRYGGPIGARQFVLEAAWANGFADSRVHSGNLRNALKAAFSTQAASDILSNVANKVLLQAYMAVEDTWSRVAAIGPCNDFKAQPHYRLNASMQYEEVAATGELKHGQTSDETYSVTAKTYGKIFVVSRQDIINDDLSAFDQLRTMMGRGAALKLNDVFWAAFMNNGSFFTAGRGNYISGATTTISTAGLGAADVAFLNQTDANGKPLGLTPAILLVPPALKETALAYMKSIDYTGGSTPAPASNTFAGRYRPEVSAYLSNAAYTGNSALAWYLLCDPANMACIKVTFLDGKQTPTVESAEADFDMLGIQVRGYHDFGVALAEYRAGVKSKGAA